MSVMDYLAEPANRARFVRIVDRWAVPVVLSVVAIMVTVTVLHHEGVL